MTTEAFFTESGTSPPFAVPITPPAGVSAADWRRFWSQVGYDETTGCAPWLGGKTGDGYGAFKPGGARRQHKAHRVAFLWAGGVLTDENPLVLHRPVICHRRECCRPEHLYAGSAADNSADSVLDGTTPRGENNVTAKLTEQNVLDIRRRFAAGDITLRDLAAEYGVTDGLLSQIVRGRYWSHVGGPVVNVGRGRRVVAGRMWKTQEPTDAPSVLVEP